MIKYISILRGINLGGHNKILMSDLKLLYESLYFTQVVTYIQSGNVIFEAKDNEDPSELAKRLNTPSQKNILLQFLLSLEQLKSGQKLYLIIHFYEKKALI